MNITYYGHSCYAIESNGIFLLVDPFITPNEKAKHIDITTIKADYIAITHGHQDHIADIETIAISTQATIIAAYEIINWLQAKGLKNKMISVNVGAKLELDEFYIRAVTAVHSSQLPDGTYGGIALGYVVDNDTQVVYCAGDTALTIDMQLISHWYDVIDAVILPIGGQYTMDIEDAFTAAEFCNCTHIIGVHFDTYPILHVDKNRCSELSKEFQIKLTLPEIGATYTI